MHRLWLCLAVSFSSADWARCEKTLWDPPSLPTVDSHDVVASDGRRLDAYVDVGKRIFRAPLNRIDGFGRPDATGDSKPTTRIVRRGPMFHRIAGPDAVSCVGCHNLPMVGGSGDASSNVFVGAHFTDPPTPSIATEITAERNTPSLFGLGAIELLAREMTEDLHAIRRQALDEARQREAAVELSLETKGISFGTIRAHPDGTYDKSGIKGVDADLIVKPFGVKGVGISLREFTVFALNQHHGIQAIERFGWERTGIDFDGDGVEVEMTIGQVSALSLYQASLPAPRRVKYEDERMEAQSQLGERVFVRIGCADCHIPRLPLRDKWHREPNPYNRPGALAPSERYAEIMLALPLEPGTGIFEEEGTTYVAAFTDLKRHVICDSDAEHFCNEKTRQDFVPENQFLTARLWDIGSSAPYGHRGDLSTVSEAILHHGGEARLSRERFMSLADQQKRSLILFLLSMKATDLSNGVTE